MLKKWNGPRIVAATLNATSQSLNKTSGDIVREAKRRAPVGVSGHYRRSIDYTKPGFYRKDRLSSLIGVTADASKDESAIVALVLETGRRKGAKMPPMSRAGEALTGYERWVMRVINPQPPPLKRPMRGGVTNTKTQVAKASKSAAVFRKVSRRESAVRGVAYLVARKIKARGLPARRIISTPFERISPFLKMEIQLRLAAMLNKIK